MLDDLALDNQLKPFLASVQRFLDLTNAVWHALGAAGDVTCRLSEGASLLELLDAIEDTGLYSATERVSDVMY